MPYCKRAIPDTLEIEYRYFELTRRNERTVTSGSSKDALETSRNFADSIPAYHAARHDALAVYIISQSEIQGNEQEATNSSDQAQERKVKKFVALCEDPDAPRK